jgi:hypothetical protein
MSGTSTFRSGGNSFSSFQNTSVSNKFAGASLIYEWPLNKNSSLSLRFDYLLPVSLSSEIETASINAINLGYIWR